MRHGTLFFYSVFFSLFHPFPVTLRSVHLTTVKKQVSADIPLLSLSWTPSRGKAACGLVRDPHNVLVSHRTHTHKKKKEMTRSTEGDSSLSGASSPSRKRRRVEDDALDHRHHRQGHSREWPAHSHVQSAWRRSLRYGAPMAVVDPLISLLFDLNRIQQTVRATLASLGVRDEDLPSPFGPPRPQPQSTEAPRSAEAVSNERDTSVEEGIERSMGTPCPSHYPADVTESVLHGVDTAYPPPSDLTDTVAPARRTLAAFLSSGAEGPLLLDSAHDGSKRSPKEDHKRRHQPAIRVEAALPPASPSGSYELVATFSAEELAKVEKVWKHYEKGINMAIHDLNSLLRSVCAQRVVGNRRVHAKWIEVAKKGGGHSVRAPSSVFLERNCEEVILGKDALATCQLAVHRAVQCVEDSVDVYMEEALAVAKRERSYWCHAKKAEEDWRFLTEMRSRVRGLRRSLKSCLTPKPS